MPRIKRVKELRTPRTKGSEALRGLIILTTCVWLGGAIASKQWLPASVTGRITDPWAAYQFDDVDLGKCAVKMLLVHRGLTTPDERDFEPHIRWRHGVGRYDGLYVLTRAPRREAAWVEPYPKAAKLGRTIQQEGTSRVGGVVFRKGDVMQNVLFTSDAYRIYLSQRDEHGEKVRLVRHDGRDYALTEICSGSISFVGRR